MSESVGVLQLIVMSTVVQATHTHDSGRVYRLPRTITATETSSLVVGSTRTDGTRGAQADERKPRASDELRGAHGL